jgi:hypothetical protein
LQSFKVPTFKSKGKGNYPTLRQKRAEGWGTRRASIRSRLQSFKVPTFKSKNKGNYPTLRQKRAEGWGTRLNGEPA